MITFAELSERLKQLDEITLLEVLDISAEEIVERFADKIEDRFENLENELSLEGEIQETTDRQP